MAAPSTFHVAVTGTELDHTSAEVRKSVVSRTADALCVIVTVRGSLTAAKYRLSPL